jgi:acetyltransferase-like isoleucine patch superfamily enzyme
MLRTRLAFSRWYVRHFVRPHFEALGEGSLFFKPWTAVVHGPGVRAGRFLHVIGEPGQEVRLSVWTEGPTHGRITLGDYVLLLPGVRMSSASSIRIGDGCMLAAGVYLTDADWHDIQDRTRPVGRTAPIVLEDNVWIGDGAFVGKGVTIGANSVVGARSVVTRDVPPDVVVAGNPAAVVRHLDPAQARVTRASLFDAPATEIERRQRYVQWLALRENSPAGWLRARWAPRPTD